MSRKEVPEVVLHVARRVVAVGRQSRGPNGRGRLGIGRGRAVRPPERVSRRDRGGGVGGATAAVRSLARPLLVVAAIGALGVSVVARRFALALAAAVKASLARAVAAAASVQTSLAIALALVALARVVGERALALALALALTLVALALALVALAVCGGAAVACSGRCPALWTPWAKAKGSPGALKRGYVSVPDSIVSQVTTSIQQEEPVTLSA